MNSGECEEFFIFGSKKDISGMNLKEGWINHEEEKNFYVLSGSK